MASTTTSHRLRAGRAARRDGQGGYVPLSQQDVALWSQPKIDEAERLLLSAAGRGAIGRFQLEAAIQSAHAQRLRSGRTNWQAIALLYEGLVQLSPTLGALVGRAAALAEEGPRGAIPRRRAPPGRTHAILARANIVVG